LAELGGPGSNDDIRTLVPVKLYKTWDLSGMMLAISIKGYDRFIPVLHHLGKARPKGTALSFVGGVSQQGDPHLPADSSR
jgi:hypothetical protein